jgi:hypothetical protein
MNGLVELFVRIFRRVDRGRMNVCLKPLFEKAMNRLREGDYSLLPPNGRCEAETSNRSMGLSENILLVVSVF